jgi:hypothetical protein
MSSLIPKKHRSSLETARLANQNYYYARKCRIKYYSKKQVKQNKEQFNGTTDHVRACYSRKVESVLIFDQSCLSILGH